MGVEVGGGLGSGKGVGFSASCMFLSKTLWVSVSTSVQWGYNSTCLGPHICKGTAYAKSPTL